MERPSRSKDGVRLWFNVEDMKERKFLKELMDEEENKNENFFSGEGYQALIKECGLPSQDMYDQKTSDFPSYKSIAAKMTDISDGQKLIFKKLISKGEVFKVSEGSLVIYNYKFYYEPQLEPFDSTRFKRRPDRQRVGGGQLLPGINSALQSMCTKERANFIFDSSVMFDALGFPPRIPRGVDIYAEIEVIDFIKNDLTDDERHFDLSFPHMLKLVVQCRDDASVAFRDKYFAGALKQYKRGLGILFYMPISTDEEERVIDGQVSEFRFNIAHCNLKLKQGPFAIKWFNREGKENLEMPKTIEDIDRFVCLNCFTRLEECYFDKFCDKHRIDVDRCKVNFQEGFEDLKDLCHDCYYEIHGRRSRKPHPFLEHIYLEHIT